MTEDVDKFAVVLTHNRLELLNNCVTAISNQVDTVIIIDNASDPPVTPEGLPTLPTGKVILEHVPDQPPNLARFWNIGLDIVKRMTTYAMIASEVKRCHVAFLCDDAPVPEGWFAAVSGAMVETGAAAGCSLAHVTKGDRYVKSSADGDLYGRMAGHAFVLDAGKGIRADESMAWWFQDTDIDWQARLRGGMVVVGGFGVPNVRYCEYSNLKPELNEQAGRDGVTFGAKWGKIPW